MERPNISLYAMNYTIITKSAVRIGNAVTDAESVKGLVGVRCRQNFYEISGRFIIGCRRESESVS